MSNEITVVVAWTEDTREMAPGQKLWRADLGERPRWVDVLAGKSAMWLNRGTMDDLTKAKAFAAKQQGGRVFVYPTTEQDPLGRARREILIADGVLAV